MTDTRARQILSSLLMEKGVELRDGANTRQLLELALSAGDLPDEISRALAETFKAVASATQTTASDDGNAVNPDGISSNA